MDLWGSLIKLIGERLLNWTNFKIFILLIKALKAHKNRFYNKTKLKGWINPFEALMLTC